MNLVPSGHRRRLREQRGAQRRQPVEGPAEEEEEEEEGVFGKGDGERGSRAGGCAASTCCPLRIFNLFVIKQRCF